MKHVRQYSIVACVVTVLGGCAAPVSREALREQNADRDLAAFAAGAPAPGEGLTLEQAVEYALQHNLDATLAETEREIQDELRTGSKLALLPLLMAQTEYSRRSKNIASSAESIETKQQTLEPSRSSEKHVRTREISLIWNLLDFGISYYRSRQATNEVSIAAERLRRVRQNLVLDVTRTYYECVVAREAAGMARSLVDRAKGRQQTLRKQVESKTVSQVSGLEHETRLIEMQIKLQAFEREYRAAKTRLASLMGAPVHADFSLAEADFSTMPTGLEMDMKAFEQEALLNRPELFQQDCEEKISADNARIAIVQMFPRPSLFLRWEGDENKFLHHQAWTTAGLRASWDLLAIPRRVYEHRAAKRRTEYVRDRRTLLAVAIISQVHLATIDYEEVVEAAQLVRELSSAQNQIVVAMERHQQEGKATVDEVLDSEAKGLFAQVRYMSVCADLITARQRVLNSLGRDPCHIPAAESADDAPTPPVETASPGPEAMGEEETEAEE